MKRYKITANSDCNLHLYADSEFAALFWKDVELDSSGQDNEDITTLKLKCGDSFDVESCGFEFVDGELINYLSITQTFGDRDLLKTTMNYVAWVPSTIIDLRKEKTKNFTAIRITD